MRLYSKDGSLSSRICRSGPCVRRRFGSPEAATLRLSPRPPAQRVALQAGRRAAACVGRGDPGQRASILQQVQQRQSAPLPCWTLAGAVEVLVALLRAVLLWAVLLWAVLQVLWAVLQMLPAPLQ